MKRNPIFRRDELCSARSFLLPLLVTACNAGLVILILIHLFYTVSTAELTGEIPYQSLLRTYYMTAALELVLLILISPALAASSISSERDTRALGLLLTTQLTPLDIIVGKLMGVLSTLSLLVLSALPALATVFIYGGIGFLDIVLYLGTAAVCAVLATSLGILSSLSMAMTAASTLMSYAGTALSLALAGLPIYFRGTLGLSLMQAGLIALLLLLLLSLLSLFLSVRQITPHRSPRRPGIFTRGDGQTLEKQQIIQQAAESEQLEREAHGECDEQGKLHWRKKAAHLFLLLSLLWMAFIFTMSQQNADTSTETSLRAGELVAELVVPGYRDWTPAAQRQLAIRIDHPVRKLAHAGEYMVLGVLYSLCYLFTVMPERRRSLFCTVLPLGMLYAASDEFHQLFVLGRAGRITDVLIDSSGVLIGILLVTLVQWCHHRTRGADHVCTESNS